MSAKATSLKDRMAAYVKANSRQGGQTCRTCSLPPEVLKIVRGLKAARGSNAAIAGALRLEGHKQITEDMIARHFKLHEQSEK